MSAKSLKEITETLAAKSKQVSQIFDEAGEAMDFTKVKCLEGDTASKVEQLRAIDAEVTDLKTQRDALIALDESKHRAKELNDYLNKPENQFRAPDAQNKSLGELFVESRAFKQKGEGAFCDINLKTVMSIAGAGWAPQAERLPRVELTAQEAIGVIDIFPILTTNQNAIKYMYESTFTNNAAEVAEAVQGTIPTFGEAALALTQASVPVEKIATFLPISDEQLEDVSGMIDYINTRLTYMVKARLDSQLVAGNGTPPNIRGVLNAGSIQTQQKGADPTPDAIFKAITLVRTVGFAEPSAILMHPSDWQAIRLLTTADGIYIFGSPMDNTPPRLWGVPAVLSTFETENTAVVGDFRGYSAFFLKRGIEFKITDSHSTYFTGGVQVIRADMRGAAVYFRGTAFCKVTGI